MTEFKEGQKVYVEATVVEEDRHSPELEIEYQAGKQCDYVPNDIIHPIPEPVELPIYVVNFLEKFKNDYLQNIFKNYVDHYKDVSEWLDEKENEEKFIRAYLTGKWIVEKEPKWYGWYNSMHDGQKVFVSKEIDTGKFRSSPFANVEEVEKYSRRPIEYQLTMADRKALFGKWDSWLTWEPVEE